MADIAFAPLPPFGQAGPLICTAGDSRIALGFDTSANFTQKRQFGVASWVAPLTQNRAQLPWSYSKAVTGARFSDVISTQLQAILALSPRPTHCILLCGTNDISTGGSIATMKLQCAQFWTAMKAAGIRVVQVVDLPRTLASWTAANSKASQEFNQWLRDYCAPYGVVLIDPIGTIADISNVNGDPFASYYLADGIHPATLASYYAGVPLAAYFNSLGLPSAMRSCTLADVYDATNNPRGNLLPNAGLFSGTGGASLGTGASGTVATGWNNRVISGTMTAVASLVARSDNGAAGFWQQAVLSASAASVYRLQPVATITGQAVGDLVYGEIDLNVSGAANVLYTQLNCFDVGGSGAGGSIAFKDPGLAGKYIPSAFGTIRLQTEPFTITTGNTDVAFRLEVGLDTGGAATLQMGCASLRKYIAQ